MKFKRRGEKTQYDFIDARCIGRQCWAAGMFQHRSPLSGGGSRNTGSPDSPCCLNRAYRGCPDGPDGERIEDCPSCNGTGTEEVAAAGAGHSDDLAEHVPCGRCAGTGKNHIQGVPVFRAELAKQRKSEGWRIA